jgi:replicative DNA helicase
MVETSRKFDHLLKPEFFSKPNLEIFKALQLYETQNGACMDEPTFRMQFPDFDWSPSDTQVEWYADELSQNYIAAYAQQAWEAALLALADDPRGAFCALQLDMQKMSPYTNTTATGKISLVEHSIERALAMERRAQVEGLAGATTGFALLDRDTHGTQPGEIELYVARPGMGKTWTLIYGAYSAWQQGKKVSFVSPEMTAHEVGIRLDAFHLHMSQMRMHSGNMSAREIDAYREVTAQWRSEITHDIIFRDTISLGRRFTVADMRRIVDEDKCDLLLIDGLLLIDPIEQNKQRDVRSRVTAVMDELKSMTTQMQVGLRAAHQVNREVDQSQARRVKKKEKDESTPFDAVPFLHQLAEAGATEQYANRVIALTYADGRMYYAVRKNRNGPDDLMFSVKYDIDTGEISDEYDESLAKRGPQQQSFDDAIPVTKHAKSD